MRSSTFVVSLFCFCVYASAAAGQSASSTREAPALDALRRAVATLPAGRVERPESYDSMTPEQKQYLGKILSGPRTAVSGPLAVMLASPALGELAQETMADARFAGTGGISSVPPKLNELAVLMAARTWSSPYVWEAHDRYSVSVGLPAALVDSIRLDKAPPTDLEPDVQAVYAFFDVLLETKPVSARRSTSLEPLRSIRCRRC